MEFSSSLTFIKSCLLLLLIRKTKTTFQTEMESSTLFLTLFAAVSGLNQAQMATLIIPLWPMRKQFLKLEM